MWTEFPPSSLHNMTRTSNRSAFVLVEIMMAITVFGMCAVAFVRALVQTSRMAMESQLETRMLLRLQSRLTEISKLRDLTPWKNKSETSRADEMGVWTETRVEEITDLHTTNQEGQQGPQLTQLYRVYVKAFYQVDWKPEPETMDCEVWRYLPLYRNNSSGGAPAMPR